MTFHPDKEHLVWPFKFCMRTMYIPPQYEPPGGGGVVSKVRQEGFWIFFSCFWKIFSHVTKNWLWSEFCFVWCRSFAPIFFWLIAFPPPGQDRIIVAKFVKFVNFDIFCYWPPFWATRPNRVFLWSFLKSTSFFTGNPTQIDTRIDR